ncbi:MAG: Zn-ribbon domain-containing OB-fold protein [Alphaproteobacteria bacterium]
MTAAFPEPVLGLYDKPMWESIRGRGMRLQCCRGCGAWRYPPGPICPKCLSLDYDWKPVSGGGKVLSWVVFHRQYLPAYPQPYNVIAVQLDEGPIMISNLEGESPDGSWIGARVAMTYAEDGSGGVLPRFRLAA